MKKFILVIICLIIIVLGLLFYWFQIRPAQIRKECASKSEVVTGEFSWQVEILKKRYDDCLLKKGLEK